MAVAGPAAHGSQENVATVNNSDNSKKSSFRTHVASLAKAVIKGGCVAALAGLVAVNPTITATLSSAFSKVPGGLSAFGSFVANNMAQFATGLAIGGAMNMADGMMSMSKGTKQSKALSKADQTLGNASNSSAFNKLKGLYRSMQRRGAIQAALGAAAVVVGGLVLSGVISNPIGLAVAVTATAGVMLAVQIHKVRIHRQVNKAKAEYQDWVDQQKPRQATGEESSESESTGAFGSPLHH